MPSTSLLEEAVLDAKTLREVAMKNAENRLLEKYTPQIKEAVDRLLEQGEEDELGIDQDFIPDDEMSLSSDAPLEVNISPEDQSVIDDLPSAATNGEKTCPCPDDDDMVEIDLNDILPKTDDSSEYSSRDQLANDISSDLDSEDDDEDMLNLTEEELEEVIREAMADFEPVPTGSAATNTSDVEEMQEMQELKASLDEKEEENSALKESIKSFKNNESKYKRIILEMKEKFDEISLSNARLLYCNRVLSDVSLNERQKKQIVESISNAKTIEEAKLITETLKNSVGPQKKERPKTLNESIQGKSQSFNRPRINKSNEIDPSIDRMQRLAGIKQKRENF